MSQLLKRVVDQDPNVQESACTAFSILVEANPERLLPYLVDVLTVFELVAEHYKGNPLVSLFDSLGSIA